MYINVAFALGVAFAVAGLLVIFVVQIISRAETEDELRARLWRAVGGGFYTAVFGLILAVIGIILIITTTPPD